jgi:hypothetical protein
MLGARRHQEITEEARTANEAEIDAERKVESEGKSMKRNLVRIGKIIFQ